MIARLERRDRGPNVVDYTHTFMTKNSAGLTRRDVTLEDVQVSSTDRRLRNPDNGVAGAGDFRLWTIFNNFFPVPDK